MKFTTTNPTQSRIFLILQAIFIAIWFAFVIFLDLAFAISIFWQFNLFAIFLAFVLISPSLSSSQWKYGLSIFTLFNIGLLVLYFVALTPVKPFMRFERSIDAGMSKNEVQRLFIQSFPKDGRFRQPEWGGDDSYLHYTLDPTDGRYNAEWVRAHFKNGGVVKTEYFGD